MFLSDLDVDVLVGSEFEGSGTCFGNLPLQQTVADDVHFYSRRERKNKEGGCPREQSKSSSVVCTSFHFPLIQSQGLDKEREGRGHFYTN